MTSNEEQDTDDDMIGQEAGELPLLSRRKALAAAGGLGILTLGTGSASAQGPGLELGGSYDASSYSVGLEIEGGSSMEFAFSGINYRTDGVAFLGKARGDGYTKGVEGQATSSEGKGVFGLAASTSGRNKGVEGQTESSDGTGVFGVALNSNGTNYGVRGESRSSDGYGLYTPDDAKIDGTMEVLGDIEVSGIKNFVQTVSSDAGPKQVKYTSVEAGEPQTEHTDVVEMENGVAIVELPDHFGMVTSDDERLAVQVTPYCDEPVRPQVTDRSTDRIVVKDFGGGPDNYTFAYTVKGVRQGFEDQEIVSDSP
jgi:hypothetical protein